METVVLASFDRMEAWPAVLLIAGVTVLLCLKVLGHTLYQAVSRHNLKIETQRLLMKYKRQIAELERASGGRRFGAESIGRFVEPDMIDPEDESSRTGDVADPMRAPEPMARAA